MHKKKLKPIRTNETKKKSNKPTKHQMNANVHFSTKKRRNRFSIGNLGTSRKPNNTAHFHNRHLNKNYYCSAECAEKERMQERKKRSKTNRNINILHFDYCFDWSRCTLHISFICSHRHHHHHYILLSIVIITKMLCNEHRNESNTSRNWQRKTKINEKNDNEKIVSTQELQHVYIGDVMVHKYSTKYRKQTSKHCSEFAICYLCAPIDSWRFHFIWENRSSINKL